MEINKFLIADSSNEEDKIYVIHTEFPRFILDVTTDEVEYWDDLSEEQEEEIKEDLVQLIKEALDFFDQEMDALED